MSLVDLRNGLRGGELSAREVLNAHLERIESQRRLNAFLRVMEPGVIENPAGPLAGIPIAIKDNICVRNVPCTCGSRMLENWVSPYDATVVERLRNAGAILIGKTNLDEFGMGSSNENSYFGPVRNPHNPTYVPGGSSGGSACAVADGQAVAALGSDTGGSVRLPAAYCGVVGLKPTYGMVSRWGLVAFASSLDQVGVFGRTVEDARIVFHVIRGPDPRDSTSMTAPAVRPTPERLTIGLPREYFGQGLDPEVRRAIGGLVAGLQEKGHRVIDVSLPNAPHAIAAYYVICCAEASANLARYDGVKYGFRAANAATLEEMYSRTRDEGFGAEVKRRILLGTYVLSAGYYDAYYGTAQQVRAAIAADFTRAFAEVDCLLTPTAPSAAFKLGEKTTDPLAMYLMDVYTTSVNLAGLPAVSIPCGRSSIGLPLGAQIIGRPFEDELILDVAQSIESTSSTASTPPRALQ